MLLAAHESRREIFKSRSRFMLPTVAPGQIAGALRIASSVLHILSQTASRLDYCRDSSPRDRAKGSAGTFQRGSFRLTMPLHRKRISQKLYRKFPHNSAETHGPHQAWIDSRNLTTITTEWKHRQPIFLHPTVELGVNSPKRHRRRCSGVRRDRLLNPSPASTLAVFDSICGSPIGNRP
jgi:hypothetical protein